MHGALRSRQDEDQHGEQNQRGRGVGRRQPQQNCGDDGEGEDDGAGKKKFVGMAAQERAQALDEILLAADFLGKQRPAFGDQVIADVRLAGGDSRIAIDAIFGFSGQRQGLARDFDFGAIGSAGDFCQLVAVKVPAVKVHGGIGAGGIFPQNLVKDDERLDDFFPGTLHDLTQTADAGPNAARLALRIAQKQAAAQSDLSEQGDLQSGNERPQFTQFQGSALLKSLTEGAEGLLAEPVS